MAAMNDSRAVSPLAEYLTNVLHRRWASDRRELEIKWEQNDNTIRRIRQKNWKNGEGEDWRADTSIGAVKQKWMTGCALVLDHVLEGGVLNFGLKVDKVGQDMTEEEEASFSDALDDAIARIKTQFELCRIDRTAIKTVFGMGKYGMAWAGYNVDTYTRSEWVPVEYDFAVEDPEDQRYEKVVHHIDSPSVEWIPCWEMYWDMTEEDIRKGDGLCRERSITAYKLRDMAKKGDGWIQDEIEYVITQCKEAMDNGESDDDHVAPGRKYLEHSKNNIKIREFRCRVPKKILEDFDKTLRDRAPEFSYESEVLEETDGHEQEILAVVANNIVVRYLPIDDETDLRKFYLIPWEDDLDHTHGVGIADNGYQAQEILNGAINAFQDNKRLAGDVQGWYNPRCFKQDGDMVIEPGKLRPLGTDGFKNIDDAFKQLVIADVGQSFLDVIRLTQEMLDDETNIPKIAQGAAGVVTPKTAYEASQMMEKSGKYIASVIRNFDNDFTEPVVNDFHEFNMMDPENSVGRGNFVAMAKGFTSYQDKILRVQKLMQVMGMVTQHPGLESMVKLMKLMEEILRANDIDPDEILYTREELAEREAAEAEAQAEAERAAQQEQNQPQEDPEKVELEKEKLTAEIEAIEREQERKDEQQDFEQEKWTVEQAAKEQEPEPGVAE